MVGRGVYQRVLRTRFSPIHPDNRRTDGGTHGGRALESLRYTLEPLGGWSAGCRPRGVSGEPMTEILTESFCERCGTRYTFESARPRVRMRGVKTVSRGLKNFVLSDDTSMDEAMAAARAETDRELTTYQLDAFHKTFNFCMSCRQYTCPNCWNEPEARCLSCAPHLGREILPAPFPDLAATQAVVMDDPTGGGAIRVAGNGAHHEAERAAPPDDEFDVVARLAALTMAPRPSAAPDATVITDAEGHADHAPEEPETDLEASPLVVEPEPASELHAVASEDDDHEAARLAALAAAAITVEHDPREDVPADLVAQTTPESGSKGIFRRFRSGQSHDIEPAVIEGEPVAGSTAPESIAAAVEPEAETASAPEADDEAARLATIAAAAVVIEHDPSEATPEDSAAPAAPAGKAKGHRWWSRPGQDLDAELDAFERDRVDVAAAAVIAAAPEAAVAGEPDEEIVAPEQIDEPETVVAAEPEPEQIAETFGAAESEPVEAIIEPEAVVAAEPEPIDALVAPEQIAGPETLVAAEAVVEAEPVEAIVEPEEIAEPEVAVVAEPVEAIVEPEEIAEPEVAVVAEPVEAIVEPEEIAEPEVAVVAEPVEAEAAVVAEPEHILAPDAADADGHESIVAESIVLAAIADEPGAVDAFVAPEQVAEPEPVVVAEPEAEAAVVAEPEIILAPEAADADEHKSIVAEAIVLAAIAAEPEPEPLVAIEPESVVAAEAEPLVAIEPESVVAAEAEPLVAIEPESVIAAEAEPVVVAEPEPIVAAEPEPDRRGRARARRRGRARARRRTRTPGRDG